MSASPTERQPHTKFPPITEPVFLPDGRRLHRFRQSSLKTLDDCTEKARFVMSGEMPDVQSDAAGLGTAAHEGIEKCIEYLLDFDMPLSLEDTVAVAQDALTRMIAKPNWRWVKYKEVAARNFISRALAVWYEQVMPTLEPLASEVTFGPLVLHEDDERVIEVTGTIDYVDKAIGLADWKFVGRKWDAWEHERWDLQPTLYTWAAREALQFTNADAQEREPFTFFVHVNTRRYDEKLQRITVWRHVGDIAWLVERCVAIARLIEAELPSWPKNDNHALCSPKWCEAWELCKGRYYADGWPKPSLPR